MSSPQVQSATLKPKPEPAELGGSQALPFLGTAVGQLDALTPPLPELELPPPGAPAAPAGDDAPAPEAPPAAGSCSLLPPQAIAASSSPRESSLVTRMLGSIPRRSSLLALTLARRSRKMCAFDGSWFALTARVSAETPEKARI